MIDAEAVAAMAVPGILAPLGIAFRHDMGQPIASTLSMKCAVASMAPGSSTNARQVLKSPIASVSSATRAANDATSACCCMAPFFQHVRHVNAGNPHRAAIHVDQPIRLRHIHAQRAMRGEVAARGDQDTGAPRRRHQLTHMAIARDRQRRAQPIGRITAAYSDRHRRRHRGAAAQPRYPRAVSRRPAGCSRQAAARKYNQSVTYSHLKPSPQRFGDIPRDGEGAGRRPMRAGVAIGFQESSDVSVGRPLAS